MAHLGKWFGPLIADNPAPEKIKKKIGRPPIGDKAMTRQERKRKENNLTKETRHRQIAVLDMETDPFDNVGKGRIFPFVACLYSDQFEPITIWDENERSFVNRLVDVIERLPGRYTIYAHNGGKFDFMFLVHRLRGKVSFKGRGIMSATIGNHFLRDSFHIIPEKLAAYHKDAFDYDKMKKERRLKHRDEIITYLLSDCKYLFAIVQDFVNQFGLKLSIGQAAMAELKRHYDVPKLTDGFDAELRQYFFGGRVECLQGRGHFKGDFRLYDVNSMYPYVMAHHHHPIGTLFDYQRRNGPPSNDTVFIRLHCRNNGALIGRNHAGETTATIEHGEFFTTIHEYECALRFGLISDVEIISVLDCPLRTTFADFVTPLYEKRLLTKQRLAQMRGAGLDNTPEFYKIKSDDLFYKLLLNNAYGKFAQNPRRFKEHYLTDPDEQPPDDWFNSIAELSDRADYLLPRFECGDYWIWDKPAPNWSFNNVGVAASITGAARAVLLEALQHAKRAIYCDTDSIICEQLDGVTCDAQALGGWDIEDEFRSVQIAGKKLYAVEHAKPKVRTAEQLKAGMLPAFTVKSKGVAGLSWVDMLDIVKGGERDRTNFGPTLQKTGAQHYITRKIRATARLFD